MKIWYSMLFYVTLYQMRTFLGIFHARFQASTITCRMRRAEYDFLYAYYLHCSLVKK